MRPKRHKIKRPDLKKATRPGPELDIRQMKDNTTENQKSSRDPIQTKSLILNLLLRLRDSGALAIMPGSTLKVYAVLITHRIMERPGFAMGAEKIMKEAGVKKDITFYNALNQLEAAGLMSSRKRGPKKFHHVNFYDLPLDPDINTLRLKAELSRQKQSRTITPKIGVSTITPKKGVSVKDEKRVKMEELSRTPKIGVSTITPKIGVSTITPKKGVSLHIKQVKQGKKEGESTPSLKISKETIKELEKTKGKNWVEKELKLRGYSIAEKNLPLTAKMQDLESDKKRELRKLEDLKAHWEDPQTLRHLSEDQKKDLNVELGRREQATKETQKEIDRLSGKTKKPRKPSAGLKPHQRTEAMKELGSVSDLRRDH